jgi:predicted nucleic acid-binding protein
MPETEDPRVFIDTNILVYLFSTDTRKAVRAEEVLRTGGAISVQVLNELANVARRKHFMTWAEVNEALDLIRAACPVVPLTVETHDRGRRIAERYGLSVYDSMIVASALLHGCDVLYSEDMHSGLVVENQVCIRNPFQENIPSE